MNHRDCFSTKVVTGSPLHGRSSNDCKDLRNNVSDVLPINNLQSLRLVPVPGPAGFEDRVDDVRIVCATPGGSAFSVTPGSSTSDHGTVHTDTDVDLGLDDGYGSMAMAVRPAIDGSGSQTGLYDVFVGVTWTHLNPAPFSAGTESKMVGAVRWLVLDPTTGALQAPTNGLLTLDATPSDPGGYAVSGLAVGDLIPGGSEELVITTLDGDLFVYEVGASQFSAAPVYRTTVDGSLGAWDAIHIGDLDGQPGNELYVAGSRGVWKWLVSTNP